MELYKTFPRSCWRTLYRVDPYLSYHKAQSLGYMPNLILGARQINNSVSKYIADKALKLMVTENKKLNGSNVLILELHLKKIVLI